MNDRYFIEDDTLVRAFLKQLKRTNEHTSHGCELYIDRQTGEKWESYLLEDQETGEDVIALRKLPYPTTEEIIRIATTSSDLDEVGGASSLLIDREYSNIEFRENLINEIEKNIKSISKERYEVIYNRALLYDIGNKREIMGKYYKEIEEDANHYSQLAERAEKIKTLFENK